MRHADLPALLLAVAIGLPPSIAHAAWLAGGNPVCVAAGDDVNLVTVPDGGGGIYVAWENRNPLGALYATHVLADGSIAPGWPVNGLLIDGGGGAPVAVSDGLGGLLLFWWHGIDVVPRVTSLNGDGSLRPGFMPGGTSPTIFAAAGPAGHYARFCADGSGGFYELHNSGFPSGIDNLILHRLTASGAVAPGWSGVSVGATPNNRPYVQVELASDPAGGALSGEVVSIADPTGTSVVGHLRRTLGDGSLGFSDSLIPNGHDGTPTGHAMIQKMSMVPDGGGGAFAAWRIGGPLGPALYMQHYLSSGSASWPIATTAPVMDAVFRDGSGGAFLLGLPLAGTQLELHRRASDGSTPAGWAGAHVLPTSGAISSFAGVLSGTHVYACWSSGGGTADDVFASAFIPDGSLSTGWSAGGNAVCTIADRQSGVVMAPGAGDDAFVAWIDRRSGTQSDIYAAKLAPSGPVVTAVPPGAPLAFAVGPVRPNPAQDFADFGLTLPDATPATVEIVDLQGRVVAHMESTPRSGPQRVTLPTQRLSNGLYLLRVRQGGHESSQRLSVFH